MNDSEFLELLNLYLDHEISAADAARLEAAVQQNPARHRTYLEYCQMQQACTILAKDFSDRPSAKNILAREPRQSAWNSGLFAAGGLAVAAACIALVLVNRAPEANQGAPSSAQPQIAVAPSVAPVPVAAVAPISPAVSGPLPPSAIAHTVTVPARRSEAGP